MRPIVTSTILALLVSACSDSGNSSSRTLTPVPNVSDNSIIQTAYENCVNEMQTELAEDNPDTPEDILAMLQDGALQTCNSAVVITCKKGVDNQNCKMILQIYDGT